MSNLPVLWVPPVTPPSPEDRPPRSRRTRHLVLAAVALILTPLIAVTVFGRTGLGFRVAEGPSTSGGNQPYIATPATAPGTGGEAGTKTAAPAAETSSSSSATAPEAPATAVGADGQPVRVIDMEKKSGSTPAVVARPQPARSDPAPAKASEATTTAGGSAEPAAAPALRASVDPLPVPRPAPPTTAEATAPATAEQAPTTPPRRPVEKRTVTRETTPPADGRTDFPDRLAAIRRAESHRAIEAPPPAAMEDDEEIIVVPRRRSGWGFLPPLFGSGEPTRPALRSFDPPGRVVGSRQSRAENCHYHAYPTDDMVFHRDVRCHWHQDPHDPSIRYVTPVQR